MIRKLLTRLNILKISTEFKVLNESTGLCQVRLKYKWWFQK